MQSGALGKHLLGYAQLLPPLFDGETEPTLNVCFGSLFDEDKSVDMMTISLQTISDIWVKSFRIRQAEERVWGTLSMADCQDLLIDEETWQAINDPNTAEYIARRLFVIKEAINSGADGARKASGAILAGIEAAYLHTDTHRAALKLYLLSLTGQLKPEDEPLRLINGAIERGVAQIKLASKGKAEGKRRR